MLLLWNLYATSLRSCAEESLGSLTSAIHTDVSSRIDKECVYSGYVFAIQISYLATTPTLW